MMTSTQDRALVATSGQEEKLQKAFWLGYIYAALTGARLRLRHPEWPFTIDLWTEDDWDQN